MGDSVKSGVGGNQCSRSLWTASSRFSAFFFSLVALLAFFSRKVGEGLLFAALVLAIVGYLLFRRWEQNRPLFTFLDVSRCYRFVDEAASLVKVETTVKMRMNHSGIQQFWFRNINVDGMVENAQIDGSAPYAIERKAGAWEFCKQFDHSQRSGTVATVALTYDLRDSFPKSQEGITHSTATRTKKLTIRIKFHPNKPARQIKAFKSGGGSMEAPLDTPVISGDGSVELQVNNPRTGGYYTVEWKW
jgi:hypothetical protein